MRIITAVKEKPFHALLSSVGIFLLVPLIQSINTPLAFEIWYKTFLDRPLNSLLYIAFSIMFGMLISLYIYSKSKCIDCKKGDINAGFGGAALGFVLGICPACFSLIGVLLPLGGSIFLTAYSPVFTALSIALILFSIQRLGGFRKN